MKLPFLLLLTFFAFTRASAAERSPNVVLFLVDDLGWRDLGCYGSSFYETPNLDRFSNFKIFKLSRNSAVGSQAALRLRRHPSAKCRVD